MHQEDRTLIGLGRSERGRTWRRNRTKRLREKHGNTHLPEYEVTTLYLLATSEECEEGITVREWKERSEEGRNEAIEEEGRGTTVRQTSDTRSSDRLRSVGNFILHRQPREWRIRDAIRGELKGGSVLHQSREDEGCPAVCRERREIAKRSRERRERYAPLSLREGPRGSGKSASLAARERGEKRPRFCPHRTTT